jgi:uncharacterized protein
VSDDPPPLPPGRRLAWRLLGGFWALALVALLGGGVVLFALGPPAPAVLAEAPAEPAVEEPPAPVAQPVEAPAATPPPPAEPALAPPPPGPPPRIAFARPAPPAEGRPRVALIAGGLGMSADVSAQAIQSLPVAVGLAFNPYATEPGPLLQQARLRGFETLLALPLEPTGFPLHDPGPRALLTGLPRAENAQRLDWLLSRHTGHVGVVGALGPLRGERFAALPENFEAMQRRIEAAGYLYIDPRPGQASPRLVWGRSVDVVLDAPPTRAEIDLRLTQLERAAREGGAAMGYLGEASPVAVERISIWAAGLAARGVVLAPPSALMLPPRPENSP